MAHKTKIGGTAYNIIGGKTKIGGTVYTIKGGKTKVNGTIYDIKFGDGTITFYIDGEAFIAPEGITFQEWATEWTDGRFIIQGNMVIDINRSIAVVTDQSPTSPDETIIEGYNYSSMIV